LPFSELLDIFRRFAAAGVFWALFSEKSALPRNEKRCREKIQDAGIPPCLPWFPAGVYPALDAGRERQIQILQGQNRKYLIIEIFLPVSAETTTNQTTNTEFYLQQCSKQEFRTGGKTKTARYLKLNLK